MVEKKKQFRYSDEEMSLIKNTFTENDDLVNAIAKVLLQLPITAKEKDILKSALNGKTELYYLLSKVFNPQLTDGSIFSAVDLWMTLDLDGKHIEDVKSYAEARELLIYLIQQQLSVLSSYVFDTVAEITYVLDSLLVLDDRSSEEVFVNLTARNTLINHVRSQLAQLYVLAGQKDETVEQMKDRLKKDSTK